MNLPGYSYKFSKGEVLSRQDNNIIFQSLLCLGIDALLQDMVVLNDPCEMFTETVGSRNRAVWDSLLLWTRRFSVGCGRKVLIAQEATRVTTLLSNRAHIVDGYSTRSHYGTRGSSGLQEDEGGVC